MWLRDFFIQLSENQMLNNTAQKYGLKLGAQSIVAGTHIEDTVVHVKKLNEQGISCTLDLLGESLNNEAEVLKVKNQLLEVLEAIHTHELQAHISIKPTQLGLDIDIDFCYDNLREIIEKAAEYNTFVTINMEKYHYAQSTFDMLEELAKTFDNVGTVIQAYLLSAKEDIEKFKDFRLRVVKGAFKESADVAYQDQLDIDLNFIELVEYHLLHGKFTSIATHDPNIIAHIKRFVADHQIARDQFEFQLLYGIHPELQQQLVQQGYNVCTYVPFGHDWYAYFMRRLAERPQNLSLVTKQVFNKKTNTLLAVAAGAFLLGRLTKKK